MGTEGKSAATQFSGVAWLWGAWTHAAACVPPVANPVHTIVSSGNGDVPYGGMLWFSMQSTTTQAGLQSTWPGVSLSGQQGWLMVALAGLFLSAWSGHGHSPAVPVLPWVFGGSIPLWDASGLPAHLFRVLSWGIVLLLGDLVASYKGKNFMR